MKVQIEKIFDTEHIGILCMSCGKNLGHIEYISEHSVVNWISWLPVCYKCFSEKIGKPCPPEKFQHAYQS